MTVLKNAFREPVTEKRGQVDTRRRDRIYLKCPRCGGAPMTSIHIVNGTFAPWECAKCKDVLYDYYVGDERLNYEAVDRSWSYKIPRVDDLGVGKKRIYGRWTPVKKGSRRLEVYLSCPICGGINSITDCSIYASGSCECFHCAWCDIDLVLALGDWRRYRRFRRSKRGQTQIVCRGRFIR